MLGASEQLQLARVEPQPQGTPAVALLGFVHMMSVAGHYFDRRAPDQRWTTKYVTPLRPAKTMPITRFLAKYSSSGAAPPAGGAMLAAAATTIASSRDASTPAIAPR